MKSTSWAPQEARKMECPGTEREEKIYISDFLLKGEGSSIPVKDKVVPASEIRIYIRDCSLPKGMCAVFIVNVGCQ